MTDLKQFQYIVTLAEELNFSKAAAKLQIAQPSLSQFINKLEEDLGVKLFDRSSSPLKLTLAGKTFATGARHILDSYTQTLDRITDVEEGKTGRIAIGTSPSICHYVLPNAVKELRKIYPNIFINIYEAKTKELREMLDTGKLDFSFCVVSDKKDIYETIPVYQETVVVAVHKESKLYEKVLSLSKNGAVNFRDLKNFGFIALENDQIITKNLFSLYKQTNIQPNISITVSEVTSASSMLKSGEGLALLPSSFQNYEEFKNSVAFFKINEANHNRTIAIQYRKGHYLTKATKKMIEILKNS